MKLYHFSYLVLRFIGIIEMNYVKLKVPKKYKVYSLYFLIIYGKTDQNFEI